MDTIPRKKRSFIMSQVKSNGNISTEISLINLFKAMRITGWRRKIVLPGSPDFIFKDQHVAVFADGCFWHGHKCRNTVPKTNSAFWKEKISANILRDKRVTRILRSKGWHVFRIWECKIAKGKIPKLLLRLLRAK